METTQSTTPLSKNEVKVFLSGVAQSQEIDVPELACVMATIGKQANTESWVYSELREAVHRALVSEYRSLPSPGKLDPSVQPTTATRLSDKELYRLCTGLELFLSALTDDGRRYIALPDNLGRETWVVKAGGKHREVCLLSPTTTFLWILLRLLREQGFDRLGRCKQCRRFFVGSRGKQFCSRRCVESDKIQRYSKKPEYFEDHALFMWRMNYRRQHGDQNPTVADLKEWLTLYRQKRQSSGQSTSSRPVSALAKTLVD